MKKKLKLLELTNETLDIEDVDNALNILFIVGVCCRTT